MNRETTCSHCSGDMTKQTRCSNDGVCVSIEEQERLKALLGTPGDGIICDKPLENLGMNCPHCSKPIDQQLVRKAANSIAGKAKRPRAQGLVRNPAGRPKRRECLCRPPNECCERCAKS